MLLQYSAIFILQIVWVTTQIFDNANDTVVQNKSEILTRRKRFLIFAEGSSVQLVFCITFPSINVVGDIILFGQTAALAYELPQDPYSPFRHKADPLHRRQDSKEIFYMNEDGRIIHRRKYQSKYIVNPAMAKRSIEGSNINIPKKTNKIYRKQMHSTHKRELNNLKSHSSEFHRTSRAALYRKIEALLQGIGSNGRECLLKTLCLVGQTQHQPQETFYQEILRAVFTFPKGKVEDLEDEEYDTAHQTKESCEKMYPDCNMNEVLM